MRSMEGTSSNVADPELLAMAVCSSSSWTVSSCGASNEVYEI